MTLAGLCCALALAQTYARSGGGWGPRVACFLEERPVHLQPDFKQWVGLGELSAGSGVPADLGISTPISSPRVFESHFFPGPGLGATGMMCLEEWPL